MRRRNLRFTGLVGVLVLATTRYAPTALPDGWSRFVLDIVAAEVLHE